jgi:hypothetical protein
MIDLHDKTDSQLRALLGFYRRRQDEHCARAVEDELRKREDPERRLTMPPPKKSRRKSFQPPDEEKATDPMECAHEWYELDEYSNRFECRHCGALGWRDGLHNGRIRPYICMHKGCKCPAQQSNAGGSRFCKKHFRERGIGYTGGGSFRHGKQGPGEWHRKEKVRM